MSRWRPQAEISLIQHSGRIKPVLALGNAACLVTLRLGGDRLRTLAPEPFNYFNHASNINLSFFWAAVIGWSTAYIADKLGANPNKARAIGVGVGFGLMTLANVIAETKQGVKLFNLQNTLPDGQVIPSGPSALDLAYGEAGSAAGAAMLDVRPRPAAPAQQEANRQLQPGPEPASNL